MFRSGERELYSECVEYGTADYLPLVKKTAAAAKYGLAVFTGDRVKVPEDPGFFAFFCSSHDCCIATDFSGRMFVSGYSDCSQENAEVRLLTEKGKSLADYLASVHRSPPVSVFRKTVYSRRPYLFSRYTRNRGAEGKFCAS